MTVDQSRRRTNFRDDQDRIILTKWRAIAMVTILMIASACVAALALSVVGNDSRVADSTWIFGSAVFIIWLVLVYKIRQT
ncbi:MAG: hypothetical protein ACPG4T_01230 [Nannocystaceae bacterium]